MNYKKLISQKSEVNNQHILFLSLPRERFGWVWRVFACCLLFCILVVSCKSSDNTIKITVKVNSGNVERYNTIASLDLSKHVIPENSIIQVKDISGGKYCLNQLLVSGNQKRLFWRIDGYMAANESRIFELIISEENPADRFSIMDIQSDNRGNLVFLMKDDSILCYNTEMKSLPAGVDSAYSRNGYIHPVWSPVGSILTKVSPPDHYHHYGIWNPWTSVIYDNKKYDLWNIGDKTGTVRFDSLCNVNTGNLFADITVNHQHIIFEDYIPEQELVIMNENQQIRAWNYIDGFFVWDINFNLFPATELPVLLSSWRYAGLAFRATENWQRDNCRMMTSAHKTRQEIDGTRAAWIYITGNDSKGESGILFLASPDNHNFPEPLRVWDANANNSRGDVMINFAPTKYEDWLLEPRKQYPFKYRIITFSGNMSYERAQQFWEDYAHPVSVKKTNSRKGK